MTVSIDTTTTTITTTGVLISP